MRKSATEALGLSLAAAVGVLVALPILATSQAPANSTVQIIHTPPTAQTRSVDLKHPPADMPPFDPGEAGECDSEFICDPALGIIGKQIDAGHAQFTINQVKVTLQLNDVIWLPNASPKSVVDHENGHLQISQYYYANLADNLARKVAAPYMGRTFTVAGANQNDFGAAAKKVLDGLDDEISSAYIKGMTVENTQALYDKINDHGRNDTTVQTAITQAMQTTFPGVYQPPSRQ